MTLLLAAETAVPGWIRLAIDHGLEAFVALLGVTILPALRGWLSAKAAESSAARVGLVLTESAQSAVAVVDRELKPKLKAALADGVLTDTEKAELQQEALRILRANVAPQLLEQAKAHFGPLLEGYLKGLIERAVTHRRAEEAGAAATKAAATVTTATDAANVFEAGVKP